MGIKREKNFNATNRFAENQSPTYRVLLPLFRLPPFLFFILYSAFFTRFPPLLFRSAAGRHVATSAEENEKPEETARDAHNSDNPRFILYAPRL